MPGRPITASIARDILDPGSALYLQDPNTLFLAISWRDLIHRPTLVSSCQDVQRLVETELAQWPRLWQTAHQRLGCQIIQNNFDRPAWRQLNNHESRHPGSFGRFINLVNQALADRAPPYFVIHDLDTLSAAAGRNLWGDERLYHHAKMPCPPQHLVDYGFSLIDGVSLERTTQLINKSNQFNLTTRRRTAAELLALVADPQWFTWTVSLRDRFGDNGLISVLLAKREDDALVIDTWLMSCRVLKRGVETLLHNYLCRWARQHGLHRIRGEYIATAKNGIVKDHYVGLGFFRIEDIPGPCGSSSSPTTGLPRPRRSWKRTVSPQRIPRPCFPSRIQP